MTKIHRNGDRPTQDITEDITDEKLYWLCRRYGEIAQKFRRKFAGLLPEVYRRRLYEKKGFSSIFEFSAKLAGMSQKQVRLVLNLGRRFEDKPVLRSLLENGEVSVNKLARVASIATVENQEALAEQARLLPQSALETLVRDQKNADEEGLDFEIQNGLFKPSFDYESLRAHSNPSQNLQNASGAGEDGLLLSGEVKQKLLELQKKGIDINTLLLEFLEKRETVLAKEAEETGESSRHIPAKTRRLLQKEFGTKCAVADCKRDAEEIHHTARFSLSQNHNPYYLAPLCRQHHQIAHTIDLQLHKARERAAGP